MASFTRSHQVSLCSRSALIRGSSGHCTCRSLDTRHRPFNFFSMASWKPTQLVIALLVLASVCSGRQPVAGPTASQRAAQSEGWLDQAVQGTRRYLQQVTSGAPTPFPHPTVAAASPYTDGQQMVLNTSASPFSAIGQLLISDSEGGIGYCSGSLV